MPDHKPFRTTRAIANLRQGRNDWYRIKNATAAGPSQLHIYDEIGFFGVTASDLVNDLSGVKGDVEVHLNTPGGDLFEGIAIYNALKNRSDVVSVVIDSLAASAGSVIAMAADPGHLIIGKNASMMIHDGFSMGIGNAKDLRELADLLDKQSDNIASIYADRTGQPAAQWREAMLAETWYVGQEAVDAGLCDFVQGSDEAEAAHAPQQLAATWDLSIFAKSPGVKAAAADTNADSATGDDVGAPQPWDPDGDGDDDSTPEGDTDHSHWSPDGKQLKPVPGKPMPGQPPVEDAAGTVIRAAAEKYDADDRKQMASSGEAMEGGSYPIKDAEDLDNAIHAVGRGGADHDAIRAHIIKRADALGLSSKIPGNWNSDGSLKDAGATTNQASTRVGLSPEALANAMAALKELQ